MYYVYLSLTFNYTIITLPLRPLQNLIYIIVRDKSTYDSLSIFIWNLITRRYILSYYFELLTKPNGLSGRHVAYWRAKCCDLQIVVLSISVLCIRFFWVGLRLSTACSFYITVYLPRISHLRQLKATLIASTEWRFWYFLSLQCYSK